MTTSVKPIVSTAFLFTALVISSVSAQDLKFTVIDPPPVSEPITWESWSLEEDQWRQYEAYMRGEGKYHYQHLDPVFVLGMIAETEKEKNDYAKLYVQQELMRTTRLIDFDERYRSQFNSLFGPLSPHDVSPERHTSNRADVPVEIKKTSLEPLQHGDRITVFVTPDCEDCSSHFSNIRNRFANNSGVSIDLFFVGDNVSDDQIRQWAVSSGIIPNDVNSGKITLNHDDRHSSFGSPRVPSAFHVRADNILGKI